MEVIYFRSRRQPRCNCRNSITLLSNQTKVVICSVVRERLVVQSKLDGVAPYWRIASTPKIQAPEPSEGPKRKDLTNKILQIFFCIGSGVAKKSCIRTTVTFVLLLECNVGLKHILLVFQFFLVSA